MSGLPYPDIKLTMQIYTHINAQEQAAINFLSWLDGEKRRKGVIAVENIIQ